MPANFDELNPRAIARRLTEYLTCPIDWSQHVAMRPVEHILHRKWFYTVAATLPGGEVDARCLQNSAGEYCRGPAEDSHEMAGLLIDNADISKAFVSESKRIADVAQYYRNDFVSVYLRDCGRLHQIRAQTPEERGKQYALKCETTTEVQQYSVKERDIGIMLPTLTPRLQEYAFWLSVENIFEVKEFWRECETEDDAADDGRYRFELAWKQLLGEIQSFRFCLDALGPVGFYNGKLANILVFDVSLQSDIFHCYPALEPIPGIPIACADDLQGLDSCFEEKRPFPFP